ncbi:2-oxoglutarate (2OG) and Fe(II)-dependent oxygenase superfamily protein [Zea mays]|uniref:2-oxoglutarate (2OG) and Fe(II)-dependent oxygenase superfamily protein n=1 Tax=Zea mays TaxID=4577 RepID=A0A1D6MC08_MAIZE|nr:2-oxoglutarate (2OG) and Fe(II)-dependent oxygenase superfamily protein [Zea mays]
MVLEVGTAVGIRTTSTWAAGPAARRRSRGQVVSFALAPASSRRVRHRCRAMQQHEEEQERPPTVRAVTIPFADLRVPVLRSCLLAYLSGLQTFLKRYNFGWSHGKEKLESGKLDTFKGSFYANPVLDVPTTDDVLVSRYPSYCRPNIWPNDNLPELEIAFKDLGKLMMEVGLMLAHHCDRYGLTCGLFTKNSMEVPCPDSAAGLYIRTRDNQVVKVVFDEDQLAYQIGETTEILSRGYLCATPHCVQAPSSENASNVDRSTFALFMQPDWNEKLKFPSEIPYHQELIPPNGTLTFGEYSERLVDKYYQTTT